jgi:hypothetical protein
MNHTTNPETRVAAPAGGRRWRRGAWFGAAVIALVALVAAAWAIVRRRAAAPTQPSAAGAEMKGIQGMSGMPGMSMGASGSARLTANQLREFGVTFGTVDVRPLGTEVRAVGTVTFDDHNQAVLPMVLLEITDGKPAIKGMITTRVDYAASAK